MEDKFVDLHTHSTYSDGTLTPAAVVAAAKDAGLAAVALSDHDTVAGIPEAVEAGRRLGVEVVPAIELSSESVTETHILGFYIDTESPVLKSKLEYIKETRMRRSEDVCRTLTELGLPITIEDAMKYSGGDIVCRGHIARAMMERGYVSSVKEAFALYLSPGKPAHSHRQAMTDEEAVRLIKDAGGLAFVAHLNQTKRSLDSLCDMLTRLKAVGLDGVEGYYTEYTDEMGREYRALAKRLGLILSGGSDFHGENKPHIKIGVGTGNLRVPYSVLEEMKRRRGI